MKLLIVTQKVDSNDPILGFFHRWIEEFARHLESVTVICLMEGKHAFPKNVSVLSLGKESRPSRIAYLWKFFRYVWKERGNYDAVFVHMNPVYVVLAGLLWKLFGKKIGLWYTHKEVDLKLWLAEKLCDVIFTASKKSFRLPSKKVQITGHGIDTEFWKPLPERAKNEIFTVLSVGRMSPVKRHEQSIVMAEVMKAHGKRLKLLLIGNPARRHDDVYYRSLKEYAKMHGLAEEILFLPSMTNAEMMKRFQEADLLVNTSVTGSLDKVVLEAMSTGLIPVTTNEAFFDILDLFGLAVRKGGTEEMARTAERIMEREDKKTLRKKLRDIVIRDHNLETLVGKIISAYAARP